MVIPRPEHPRPDWSRASFMSLNGTWNFCFEQVGDGADIGKAPFDRRIEVPFAWPSPLSGIGEDAKGAAYYRRTVRFAPANPGDAVELIVGAADYDLTVWINGQEAGKHQGGYAPCRLDVTALWLADDDNEIILRTEDNDGDGQTRGKQGYGEIRGVWQSVYMESHPAVYLRHAKIDTALSGEVTVHCTAQSPDARDARVSLDFGEGARLEQSVRLNAGETDFTLTMNIVNPQLWTPDTPHLYEGTVSLDGDAVSTYFGIRTVGKAAFGTSGAPCITLNGEPLYLNGTLDQSFNADGHFTMPSDDAIREDVLRLKALGLNLCRIHIKPEEPRKLYWMDKLGMMVMEDMCCFWGEPDEAARAAWEREAREVLERDCNHPSIIAWVMFNETWGLFTPSTGDARAYLPETQAWVKDMVHMARGIDGTRLIEDNSACNYDHVTGDVNSWHFYINGYRNVKDHIKNVADKTFPGSPFNYIGGNLQDGAPLINSECGMVWGVEGSAGDSDIAWQYRYMLNEFRLHEKIGGFVFTEFTDVVNEFNGYYRLDRTPKDFGYGGLCPGMTVADLHAADFIAIDAPPCQTVGAGQVVRVPFYYSNYNAGSHNKPLAMHLSLHGQGGMTDVGTYPVDVPGYGVHALGRIPVRMPDGDDMAVLYAELYDGEKRLSGNFIAFDVRGRETFTAPDSAQNIAFDAHWTALEGEKLCCAGAGSAEYRVDLESMGLSAGDPLRVTFEASAKRMLKKDMQHGAHTDEAGANYMHGYRVDPGENANSCFMTDESRRPSHIKLYANDVLVGEYDLPNEPADARGVLSWHYQKHDRHLDDAGSYGYLCEARVPAHTITGAELVLRIEADDGVAIYGRNAGRYPIGIVIARDDSLGV